MQQDIETRCRPDPVRQLRAALECAHPRFNLEAVVKDPRLLLAHGTPFSDSMAIVAADPLRTLLIPTSPRSSASHARCSPRP
jgi:hypothetical protein